ncbi:MAG: cytochrome c553 [Candidatus Pelagisphaera sp.]|jgi:cytochrome c553
MACHLQSGMGIREMNAPSIAGLPRWYVTDQLRKFRRDQRGFHADDAPGHLMQANAAALDEKSIAFVGRHIESLKPNENRNTLAEKATKASKSLYRKQCQDCHGEHGEGDRPNRVPPLTSQQDWYLLKQIENFQTGKRIHIENDSSNELDEEQLQSIVAWICSLPALPPK